MRHTNETPPSRGRLGVVIDTSSFGAFKQYTLEELDAMPRQDLLNLLTAVEGAIINIRAQLDAEDDGSAVRDSIDPTWLSRATAARRRFGQLAQAIQRVLAKQRREESVANAAASMTHERLFIDALRLELEMRYGREAAREIFKTAGEKARQ